MAQKKGIYADNEVEKVEKVSDNKGLWAENEYKEIKRKREVKSEE